MKNNTRMVLPALIAVLLSGLISCNPGGKDATIKADLATKAKAEKDFAGVRFTVENGIVTINGECATITSKNTVETTVKGLYGVKDVVNNIRIAPVVIGTDQLLKQGVDSILKKYASVEAITKDSIVILKGKIENDRLQKLQSEISGLRPKQIENALTMK